MQNLDKIKALAKEINTQAVVAQLKRHVVTETEYRKIFNKIKIDSARILEICDEKNKNTKLNL